jgi:patatin-related protein
MALLTRTSRSQDVSRGLSPLASAAGRASTVELRLAVVFDGGVSLAIYEHGVAKELQHLIVAARCWDDVATGQVDRAEARARLTGTQPFYFDALANRAATQPVSVVIDVISGTSAGGINGVCLAKGLAGNRTQDPITRVWLENGDLGKLAHRFLPGLRGALMDAAIALPSHAFSAGWSPLRGDLMAVWLVDALSQMDSTGASGDGDAPETLLPADHSLDLFVTATDLNGLPRTVPSRDGGPGEHDYTHRKVFHYATPDRFGPEDNFGLAFAARCTSSFPGAFAPNQLQHFFDVVKSRPGVAPNASQAFIDDQLREYTLAGKDPASTPYGDGGLLDNSPFDHVIAAIAAKSAQTRVDRRILHIEPDPGTWGATRSRREVRHRPRRPRSPTVCA